MKQIQVRVNGENSHYFIKENGDIISYARKKPIILKTKVNRNGYRMVGLNHKGKYYTKYLHRLLATYFIKNKDKKPEVNHIDGNKIIKSLAPPTTNERKYDNRK